MKKSLKTIVKSAVAVTALSVMCAVAACSNSGEANALHKAERSPAAIDREISGENSADESIAISDGENEKTLKGERAPHDRGEHKGRRKPPVSALPDTSETADGETDDERPHKPPMPRGAIMFLIVPAPGAFDFLPPPPKAEEPDTEQSGETDQPTENELEN